MASSDSKLTKVDPRSIGSPKGTRDFYPEDLLRRRYITEVWRAVSIRHGFEEIDGPTFEHSELYAVKSGEGILGELFQAFSGKAEDEREQVRETGNAPFALRPEFTPTLARMYAAKAKQLPKPVRWFCVPNFFRAEKPQRGRLREFMQWNVDVVDLTGNIEELTWDYNSTATEVNHKIAATHHDIEVMACAIDALRTLGISAEHIKVRFNDRTMVDALLADAGIDASRKGEFLQLLDAWAKLDQHQRAQRATALGSSIGELNGVLESTGDNSQASSRVREIMNAASNLRIEDWLVYDPSIVRGLAYYTGTVFELIAEGERAVAGGGRYDNLIELFGGPPPPACGFGMGVVVLGNLLDDHGLMPADGAEMMDAIQRTVSGVSLRPEVFVVSGGEEHDHLVQPLLANLRAGIEADGFDGKPWDAARFDPNAGGVRPMHARTTAKATRNLKKLLSDAERQYARFAVIIHGDDKVQVKDLDRRDELPENYHVRPDADARPDAAQGGYVGRVILERLAQSH